ncbi:MAG: hypothetical protein IKP45_09790 [Bacteroidales bacterium]|nr:hypothetical protein [Bacteroidales bacterium]
MKSKFYFLAVAIIMAAVFSGCKEKPEEIWLNEGQVTTVSASHISRNSAILEGDLYSPEVDITERGFFYDTTREMYSLTKVKASDTSFSALISDLNASTNYYYYAFATAYGKTKQGDIKMFKTQDSDQYYIDFETGDFSQARFGYTSDYPWEVTTDRPYEGSYCMKSTNTTNNSGRDTDSYIDLYINCIKDRVVSFYVDFYYASNYDRDDYFTFYIDNEQVSGNMYNTGGNYSMLQFTLPQGEHTLRWNYHVHSTSYGRVYVDKIEIK